MLLAAALALTCLSAAYQRTGPRRVVSGEGFCDTPAPCTVPALAAGFPLPFVIDNPQISVPNAIGIGEDDFRADAFAIDVLIYFTFGFLVLWMMRRRRRTNAPV
ncbi:hypothetical protein [Longimicrobium sp.]|uniref:hypothetical protein n=1 Tax=Longimicrobium sp. TaxID=2029185 RepID=UPI003B3B4007